MAMLEDRRATVLRALVEEYIASGEPVSSRAILERTGLDVSGATVRNDLAALEAEGYAAQPHTSAGRIPTAAAYRYYVEHLTPPRLRAATRDRIAAFFNSVHLELGKLLKATSQLLADVTHYPAVVVGPPPTGERVKALHVVQLSAERALLVVVTESGQVCQEACDLPTPVDPQELGEVERLLAGALVGGELTAVEAVGAAGRELSPPARAALDVLAAGVGRAAMERAELYVGGARQMPAIWEDLQTVHRVLEVLEREAMILDILARASGTYIQIGDDLPVEDLAVVSTTFPVATGGEGRVGVIGPMRMDYKKAISAVEEIGRELGDRISG